MQSKSHTDQLSEIKKNYTTHLEATLASISAEMTEEAIERQRRETGRQAVHSGSKIGARILS